MLLAVSSSQTNKTTFLYTYVFRAPGKQSGAHLKVLQAISRYLTAALNGHVLLFGPSQTGLHSPEADTLVARVSFLLYPSTHGGRVVDFHTAKYI